MLAKSDVAIMGDKESIMCFRSVGIDAYDSTPTTAKETARKLARDYKIIFVTDDIYSYVEDFVKKLDDRPYPILLSIPSAKGSNGRGMETLRELSEKALGVNILNK